ncbi:hypothetical protein [Deinococcus sp.]|uniref:hypothetical protein n=1 Tax=Deinococcus sp. TaxID=47478 RepID=UPI003C7E6002
MTQPPVPLPAPTPPVLTPSVRAGRLAERLSGRCLRAGEFKGALREVGVLDSGALAALPRLSGDLSSFQQRQAQEQAALALPADPLGQLLPTAPVPRRKLGWPRKGRQASGAPVLSTAEWQTWRRQVEQASARLARQWESLSELQARQARLVSDLRADALTLALASEALLTDEALPEAWRWELASSLKARVADVQTALSVATQLGEATGLLLGNHHLVQGRLAVAANLMLYAAQTGISLQQALDDRASLRALPGLHPLTPQE